MILLDGRKAREHYISVLKERINKLSFTPCLVILQIGNRPDSDAFIKAKKSFAAKIGVKEMHVQLPEDISEKEVIDVIEKYNKDESVSGIIVQLPLPVHLNADKIIESIDPKKDTDGLTSNTLVMPATARGVKQLLDFYKINLFGKKVTVIGKSKLVGTPIANMAEKSGAIVTVCDSQTENVPEKAQDSDILIVAIGKKKFIDEKYVKKEQIVIDVGITRDERGILVGDVDFEKVGGIVSMITPVPGGVGQMTVLSLFENLIDACYNAEK